MRSRQTKTQLEYSLSLVLEIGKIMSEFAFRVHGSLNPLGCRHVIIGVDIFSEYLLLLGRLQEQDLLIEPGVELFARGFKLSPVVWIMIDAIA